MATPRKRSTGFSEKPKEEISEETQVEELLDEVATEVFETISHKEEEKPQDPLPVILPPIAATEDAGPRFVEQPPAPAPQPKAAAPKIQPPPKRHPRNIPKFSRYK
jgi:hypothetical protein